MNFTSEFITYNQTGFFSALITDYLNGDEKLSSFYHHPISIEGIKAAIEERRKLPSNRKVLVEELQKQYQSVSTNEKVKNNIEKLVLEKTFTITTAHQPNIFTGPLYFIYKILHAIKLSEYLNTQIPNTQFIPIYYMGSEDADLEELSHIYINGEKYEWETKQTGAVGRMKVDDSLLKLIDLIAGQMLIYPFGKEIIELIKDSYQEGTTIEQATFKVVNTLFAEYGLVILLPDNANLKRLFIPVIEKELTEQFSHKILSETFHEFPKDYKIQPIGRELNLFYLNDDSRERIEKVNGQWAIDHGQWTKEKLFSELRNNPERFSPNVVLRPVFQEMILPNVAFVGGGGEITYWLQLKNVFKVINVPFPVLILRNSFLVVSKDIRLLKDKLPFSTIDLFGPEYELVKELVQKKSSAQLSLDKEKIAVQDFYQHLKDTVSAVDTTLQGHIEALKIIALKKIIMLEKKMLRAEKKKFDTEQRQLHKIKNRLFPNNKLQERVDNFMLFYAKWGKDFIKGIYEQSHGIEQKFNILIEK